MATLASSLGSLGGPLGDAASQVANFIFSVKQMGAVGGIIAGAQMAISMISDHFIKKVDEMKAAVDRMATRVREKLDKVNGARLEGLKKSLDEATTKARQAAAAFEAMASAYMKTEKAKLGTENSARGVEASALNLEKSRAMAGAKDDNERARIGAEYDEKIAKANLTATEEEQSGLVATAEDELAQSRQRARDAKKTERDALRAKEKADKEYADQKKIADATGVTRDLDKFKLAAENADKVYEDAKNNRVAKVADEEVADEGLKQAKLNQTAAINEARRGIVEAESASKQLADAQLNAAKAELDREKAEQKAAEAARRKAAADEKRAALAEKKDSASAEVSRWQGEFNAAFDLWRDPEAAQQAVDADKKRGEDMKAFRKAVNRYGGKGKIDEYAALMRAGDEEGMQDRLAQWRKSSKFTPQVEQMVKAAAADQNRNAAEKSLANIEKNTADLAKKIDELLSLK